MPARTLTGVVVGAVLAIAMHVGAAETTSAPPTAQAEPSAAALKDEVDRRSYAMGMNLASQFRQLATDVNLDPFILGLKDAMSGVKTQLTEQEMRTVIGGLQQQAKKRQTMARAEERLKNRQAREAFFAQSNAKEGVMARPTAQADTTPAAAASTKIHVSFKLDPSVSGATYGGERWVSPQTYTTSPHEGNETTVEARAEGVGLAGQVSRIQTSWTAEDPKMLSVSEGKGGVVAITVKRPGTSKLSVASAGLSKDLQVKASVKGKGLQVEISQ
jgi:hypothetical protein